MNAQNRFTRALLGWAGSGLLMSMPALGAPPAACDPAQAMVGSSSTLFTTQSTRFDVAPTVTLGGCLYRPRKSSRFPVLVMVTGSGNTPSAADDFTVPHAQALAAKGIGVFAFNKRGVGGSGGVATNTDFKQRADDVAAAVRFVRSMATTTQVALWGVSQAGWVIPQALRPNDGVKFVILVSPGGVNPNEQMAFFIRKLALRLGCSQEEAAKAERVHRALMAYYATGKGYASAQALVNEYKKEPWFERFRTNDEWPEGIGADGRLMTPAELVRAQQDKPADYGFYRAPSIFADYQTIYEALNRPTLIVQGSGDTTEYRQT